MADGTDIRRLELALSLLAFTAAVLAVIVTLDAMRFHTAALAASLSGLRFGDVQPEGVAVLALAGVCIATIASATGSGVRQLLAQRSFVRRLHRLGTATVDGREIVVVRGTGSVAFCAGLMRPRIFVSQGALRRLDRQQLRAVVAHEGHHADRRDPLRLLVGRAFVSSLGIVPGIRALGRRQAVLVEIAADAAAVRSLGTAGPLAGALLAFDEDERSVAPERVDHLLGQATTEAVPPLLLVLAGLGLGALTSVALLLLTQQDHPVLPVSSAPLCVAAVSVIAGPAWLASRRSLD